MVDRGADDFSLDPVMPETDKKAADALAKALAAGGNEEAERRKGDGEFYPTPPEVTEALLDFIEFNHDHDPIRALEPHCGEGGIANVLAARGFDVIGCDIQARGDRPTGWQWHPRMPLDFGMFRPEDCLGAEAIIMNPPFSLATDHIRHALSMPVLFVACLLPANFWFAGSPRSGRLKLFEEHRPDFVLPCAWRPDFTGEGANMFNVQWCVWVRPNLDHPFGFGAECTFDILPKPSPLPKLDLEEGRK